MIASTLKIPVKLPPKVVKTLVVIDFGNGDVKAKMRPLGADEWLEVKFASSVALGSNPSPEGFELGDAFYLVGEAASRVECRRTGDTERGKIQNALPLLLHALRESVGLEAPIVADVIFTCPSTKQYGTEINEAISGVHEITIPGDAIALIPEKQQTITIGKVVAQLEGHRALELVKNKIANKAVLVDIGNRTIIVSVVEPSGRITARKPFDSCGVQGIVSRVLLDEALAGFEGLKRCPNEADIMQFLLNGKSRKGDPRASAIATQVRACTQDVAQFIEQTAPGLPVFLLGGGAALPGIGDVFSGKVIPKAQWATVNGLCTVADQLLKVA